MPLVDNLVAYYELEEAGDTIRVDGEGSNDLALFTTGNGSSTPGIIGNAVELLEDGGTPGSAFAGNALQITQAAGTDFQVDTFSVSFWFNILVVKSFNFPVTRQGSPPTVNQWRVQIDQGPLPNYRLRFAGGAGGANWDVTSPFVHTPGVAAFCTVTRILNGPARVYFNGSLEAEDLNSGADTVANAGDGFSIGGRRLNSYSASENFIGWIDECGYWTRALMASEVSQLYNGGAGLTLAQIQSGSPIVISETLRESKFRGLKRDTNVRGENWL